MFRIGLNPYGIAYWVGLFGSGTPRANSNPLGLHGFLDLVDELGLAGVEIPVALLKAVAEGDLARVRERIHSNGKYAILMHGIPWGDLDGALAIARKFNFPIVRLHLTAVLRGGRYELGDQWPHVIRDARAQLKLFAAKAADAGIMVTVENHQDLTSGELIEICNECGSNVGVCLDTGNPLSVAEDPVEFARAVAPWVKHVHLKDYLVVRQPQGYALMRCAIGSGEVPFRELEKILKPYGDLPASIEPGALEARYIWLLKSEWWTYYAPRDAKFLALFFQRIWTSLAREDAERTPWETGASADEIVKYERSQLATSVRNSLKLSSTANELEVLHRLREFFRKWES